MKMDFRITASTELAGRDVDDIGKKAHVILKMVEKKMGKGYEVDFDLGDKEEWEG